MLDDNLRYLQIAFNYDINLVQRLLPKIRPSPNIFIEAGTPFIKREGMRGIRFIRSLWSGIVIADIKTADGAVDEVNMVNSAGASGITVLGNSPTETINFFIDRCKELDMISMIDMIGVNDPLDVLRPLRTPPDVVVLHLGRDEESTSGKLIQYRHVKRIRSKFESMISAAGGVGLHEARSAVFNGANIIVANLVKPGDPWNGISTEENLGEITAKFLETIA